MISLSYKPDLQLKPVNLVCIDLFRRHYLVYDVNFQKIGTVDRVKGNWTFTYSPTGESFWGFSRDNALACWQQALLPFSSDGKYLNEPIVI